MRNESQINVTSTTANGHEGEGQEHKGLEEKKLSIVKRQEDQRHGGHGWAVREMRTMCAWVLRSPLSVCAHFL